MTATVTKFEELLDAFEGTLKEFHTDPCGKTLDACTAPRLALVAYFEERVHSERQAVAAMLYLGGKLATKDKLSPAWITEAIKATADVVDEVPR